MENHRSVFDRASTGHLTPLATRAYPTAADARAMDILIAWACIRRPNLWAGRVNYLRDHVMSDE